MDHREQKVAYWAWKYWEAQGTQVGGWIVQISGINMCFKEH